MKRIKISLGHKSLAWSLFLSLILLFGIFYFFFFIPSEAQGTKAYFWSFQSIDTMKYSRDLAREKLNDPSFDAVIAKQMKDIASTGATHVAIATPYDEEFYPMLQRWVRAARREHLHVWFRGNFSGWEGWFSYKKITRDEHMKKMEEFLNSHPDIFANGDVFTPCPECENGGPGDPRLTGDVAAFRQFLIDEYKISKHFFITHGKNVASNYDSMNKDVAELVMDKKTTKSLDGIVTIDHYVATGDKLLTDINALSDATGGKIVLGEFGAPIPDINGTMTEKEQAEWIEKSGRQLVEAKNLIGVNYWVNTGGSTQLWNEDGTKRQAVDAITLLYSPSQLRLSVLNELGRPISHAVITGAERFSYTSKDGVGVLPYFDSSEKITISANDYKPVTLQISEVNNNTAVLAKEKESPLFRFMKAIYNFKIRK